ncbi:MAG TPA: SDR family NAD(P)-dependent oxidoreductase [Candidatus Micrarchaeaceae archaeon]|nr:SDR family NAD(P)-dependent oxidoreductase [Candidatus Micrarchaeaceae archaeon]
MPNGFLPSLLSEDQAEAVPTDVTNEQAMRALLERAAKRFGRLDIMVNNAGISDDGPAEAESLEEFERVLRSTSKRYSWAAVRRPL